MKRVFIYIFLFTLAVYSVLLIQSCSKSVKKVDKNGVIYYYTSSISEKEADKLLDYVLKEGGYPENNKITIRIDFENDAYLFQIMLKNGTQLTNEQIEDFKLYAQQLSKEIFSNKKVVIQIIDEQFDKVMDITPFDI